MKLNRKTLKFKHVVQKKKKMINSNKFRKTIKNKRYVNKKTKKKQNAGAITNFIPIWLGGKGNKLDEFGPQMEKLFTLYIEDFGLFMNPTKTLRNLNLGTVTIGNLIMSHPVLGITVRINAMSKTLKRAEMVKHYLNTIYIEDNRKFELIRMGEIELDYLHMEDKENPKDEIFWSQNEEANYDPITVIPLWLPRKKQVDIIEKWIERGKNLTDVIRLKDFRKNFGLCPCYVGVNNRYHRCNDKKGYDSNGKIKCNLKKKDWDCQYLILSGQGRALAIRMGIMDFNKSVDEDKMLDTHQKKQKKINLNKCKIGVTMADSSVPHGFIIAN